MRHQKSGRKFSRTSSHRHAMFSNMVAALLTYERIHTTEPKAKELRRIAERTISWGMSVVDLTAKPYEKRTADERAKIVHAMRMAQRVLRSDEALEKLFSDVNARFKGRPGGYTRMLKTGPRRGDATPMVYLELVVRREPEVEAPAPEPESTEADEGVAPKAQVKKAKAEKAPAKEKPAKKEKAEKPAKKSK
jgi:large subunit ribosomal protein L17